MKTEKIKNAIRLLFSILAITILIDYSVSGNETTELVKGLNKSFENYNNAAGNSHYSYKLETKNFNFNISNDYYNLATLGDEIRIKESPIFKEVNASTIVKENYTETYSLRRITGLFIPLVVLTVLFFSFKALDKIKILAFVTLIVSIADVIYLML